MTDKATLEEIERLSEGRTPGNWRVAPVGDYANGGINIDAGTGGYICLIDGSAEFPIEHSRADANLIAHAPRLLEICREQAEALRTAKAAMRDMLCGWKIIRAEGGEEKIYGIGWDRAQSNVEKALHLIE